MGNVGAVRAGVNRAVEVLAELGMVFAYPRDPLANRAGHTGASALRGGRGSSVAPAQADRARELSDQEVTLGVGLGLPLGILERARLGDVVFDLGEPAAVGVLGSCVEQLAGVAEQRARHARRADSVGLPCRASRCPSPPRTRMTARHQPSSRVRV